MTTQPQEEVEHGIAGGHYSNFPGPPQTCVLECLCGRDFGSYSWEDAGYLLDEHLKDAAA